MPIQAINDTSIGIVRIRLQSEPSGTGTNASDAFQTWLAARGFDGTKATYLVDQLKEAHFDTLLAVVPGDERFLDDIGFYIGGSPGKSQEFVEDILIKVGGLFGAALSVADIGNGWFYIGINGDGVVAGASEADAEAVTNLLERVGDHPAIAVISVSRLGFAANRACERAQQAVTVATQEVRRSLSIDELGMTPEQDAELDEATEQFMQNVERLLPKQDSRLMRRVRGIGNALLTAEAIAATVDNAGSSRVLLVFRTESDANALISAIDKMKRDMALAIQGSLEQKEITPQEAQRARDSLDSLQLTQRGATIALYETPASP